MSFLRLSLAVTHCGGYEGSSNKDSFETRIPCRVLSRIFVLGGEDVESDSGWGLQA